MCSGVWLGREVPCIVSSAALKHTYVLYHTIRCTSIDEGRRIEELKNRGIVQFSASYTDGTRSACSQCGANR